MSQRSHVLSLAVAALVASGAAQATTVSLDSFDNGWYRNDGVHDSSNTSPITGVIVGQLFYRSFFAFQLPSLSSGQTVRGATISFVGGNGVNFGADLAKSLGLFDYAGSIDQLLQGSSVNTPTLGRAIYTDLGSGESYGNTVVSKALISNSSTPMPAFDVVLNATAVNDILQRSRSGDRRFVIGGSLLESYGTGATETIWSSATAATAARLHVEIQTVPLPGTLALCAAAVAAMAWTLRRPLGHR